MELKESVKEFPKKEQKNSFKTTLIISTFIIKWNLKNLFNNLCSKIWPIVIIIINLL